MSSHHSGQELEKERLETLQKYVSDMVAVEEHIGSAFKRQQDDKDVHQHNPQVSQIINELARLAERHEEELERHLESIGGDKAKGLKEAASAITGALAGVYDKVRNETVSKMLRDDYTALNLAAVSYTMLHTTGLSLNHQPTASLALRHLQDYTGIIMQINEVIPRVVVADLRDEGATINESILQQAIDNTQRAWQPSATGNGSSVSNRTVSS